MDTSAQRNASLAKGRSLQLRSFDLRAIAPLLFQIGCLFSLFSAVLLLRNVMGGNEVDVLPLVRQYVQPGWISDDWYLNQPPGYRLLFQTIAGKLTTTFGFFATSIAGRLFYYLLLSVGIVFIARKLGIKLLYLIFAITLNLGLHWFRGAMINAESYFPGKLDQILSRDIANLLFYGLIVLALCLLAVSVKNKRIDRSLVWIMLACGLFLAADNRPYSIVSNEWFVGGLEAKTIAYSLVFLAIALMLYGKYLWMAVLLGIATSFHVLAGGYPALAASIYLLLRKRQTFLQGKQPILALMLYLAGAAFAIPAVVTQLVASAPQTPLKPSFIYVFIRLPHHLNPVAWPNKWWIGLIFYLSIAVISLFLIRQASSEASQERFDRNQAARISAESCSELFEFAMIAMVPFFAGLLIAPFDRTGAYLQYYPFRFGDMFLPFSTYLLFAAAIQSTVAGRHLSKRPVYFAMTALVVLFLVFETEGLKKDMRAALNFPNLPTEKADLYQWVSDNTQSAERFITPPVSFEEFSWVAERPVVVNLKLLPQTKSGIVEWYDRINDVSGGTGEWAETALSTKGAVFNSVSDVLRDSYQGLDTAKIKDLLSKYQASYFVTAESAEIDLPIAFENSLYTVYRSETAKNLEASSFGG